MAEAIRAKKVRLKAKRDRITGPFFCTKGRDFGGYVHEIGGKSAFFMH